MKLIDKKNGKLWPKDMANRKLGRIRQTCRNDLRARDEGRGILAGKLTTTVSDPTVEGKTKEVVDPVKQSIAHTGAEFNTLLESRWAEFCSEPRDLDEFIASSRSPEAIDLEAKKEAAAAIEESLKQAREKHTMAEAPGGVAAPEPVGATTEPVGDDQGVDADGQPNPPPVKAKGRPGRKPKAAATG